MDKQFLRQFLEGAYGLEPAITEEVAAAADRMAANQEDANRAMLDLTNAEGPNTPAARALIALASVQAIQTQLFMRLLMASRAHHDGQHTASIDGWEDLQKVAADGFAQLGDAVAEMAGNVLTQGKRLDALEGSK